ncbi:Adenosine deaminase [Chlamydia abortus]|nr:Adenosine deaminase [Chlamydia abortus]
MLERMANPPSLLELSRMIGINDNKLKIGFKELYGTTVFGYLREKRLEKALNLIRSYSKKYNMRNFSSLIVYHELVWGRGSHIAAFRILYVLRIKLSSHIGKLPLYGWHLN